MRDHRRRSLRLGLQTVTVTPWHNLASSARLAALAIGLMPIALLLPRCHHQHQIRGLLMDGAQAPFRLCLDAKLGPIGLNERLEVIPIRCQPIVLANVQGNREPTHAID